MIDASAFSHLNVSVQADGSIVFLRFEHGKVNEVSRAVLHEIEALVRAIEADVDARALISWSERTSSRGTPIFISGADVTERVGWSEADVLAHVRMQREILLAVRELPVIHIVIVNGVAYGWGTEFLLTADVALALSTARFALPETGLGIVPGAGGTSDLWSRVGPRVALRLGLTGEVLQAEDAVQLGLVDASFPDLASAHARALALAQAAATRSPTANAAFKRALLASIGADGPARRAAEDAAYAHCLRSGEAARGRERFADKGESMAWTARVPFKL